ncbi:hypothetical protein PIB30_074062 [Stylosanthes scabra]|uniref:Uncharacterized protein n=1 Tax=Stylosanthes scabra TaxID=79078 RepID=A0ABU6RPP8_9FABA|nr:hypothetical protein [Stylosanthes scabra]
MASSSNAPKRRKGKGKALADDDSDAFDPTKFKSPFHQNFFNTYVASKAIIQDATFDLQDVRYPQIIHYERVKEVMKFKGPLKTEMSYKTRMILANHDPDAIIRDLCVKGAVWELGAHNKPRILRRTDLIPIAKG